MSQVNLGGVIKCILFTLVVSQKLLTLELYSKTLLAMSCTVLHYILYIIIFIVILEDQPVNSSLNGFYGNSDKVV